jgi:hypothetical protein
MMSGHTMPALQAKANKSTHYIYISPNGKDAGKGNINSPYATLEKAKLHIRKLKASGGLKQPVTVYLRAGIYRLSVPFILDAKDAGSASSPIIYKAYPGEKVILNSALNIDTFLWEPLQGQALKRIHPKVQAEKLRMLDLNKLDLKNADSFAPKAMFSDEWYTIDLFANGKRQPISQWPNPAENIRNLNEPGWVTANGAKDSQTFYYGAGGKPEDKDETNELDFDGVRRSLRWTQAFNSGHDLWLQGFWRVPWEPFTMLVKSINYTEKTITLAEEPVGGMGSKYSAVVSNNPLFRTGNGKEKWKALNLLEEVDYPGEWAIDFKDQKLYYYPTVTGILGIEIADKKTPIIKLNETSHIHFSDLQIEGGLGDGIEIDESRHIKVLGCTFRNLGNTAIVVKAGMDHAFVSNNIYHTGGSGILLINVGDRKKLLSGNTLIRNNHIHHIGELSSREAIQLRTCVGVTLSNNLLHDLPKSAIRTDMINNCLFEYNEIHNIALKESDNGAFYNYGGWSTYGNIFRYNFIHHLNRSNGFYCDDGDSGDIFYNNIVYDAIDAVKFGGGHDNIARNNLFVKTKNHVIDDRGISRNYKIGSLYEERLLEVNPYSEPWKSYGKELVGKYNLQHRLWEDVLDRNWAPEYPHGCAMFDNVAVEAGPFRKPENGKVTVKDNTMILKISDAGFRSYKEMDLRTDNALVLQKFPKLNEVFPKIGLQKDSYRIIIPTRKETGGLTNRGRAGDEWNEDQFID